MEKCTPVPWCCTIIIFGEYTFVIASTLMIIRYDYKPIITENCGDFSTLKSVGSFTLLFLFEYIMYSSLFPWKQTLKYMSQFVSAVQDFLCVECVTVLMVQAWFREYQITSLQLK